MFWGKINLFNMRAKLLFTVTLLLISFITLRAQNDEQIINEILFELFGDQGWQKDTIFVAQAKIKTFFYNDINTYEYIMGFAIPSNIISEWKENIEEESLQSIWNEEHLNKKITSLIENDTLIEKKPFFRCLSEDEIDKKFMKNQELWNSNRQQFYINHESIYSIGKIIFDKSKETAIFRFVTSSRFDVASGYTVLIKKIFGKWVIITRFDYWMT
jgi:hypothetical protein